MTGSLSILTYHAIDASGSVLSVRPETFRRHMEALSASGCEVTTLSDALQSLRQRAARGRPLVAITFDDGYESVHQAALPILRTHGFKATVFVASAHVGKINDWPGQPAWVPRQRLLDHVRIEELRDYGCEIGSHTVTHPDLAALVPAEARVEIETSRKQLEDTFQCSVTAFAYPCGRFNDAVRELVAACYRWAVSTELRKAGIMDDPWALPRVDAYYVRPLFLFRALHRRWFDVYLRGRQTLRHVREARGR